jgi:hypothetical protein
MKVIITQKQLQQIRENASKKFSCEGKNCEHSWEIEKKDKHPYLCHMCGYDSAKEKHNYDELENFWKNYKKEEEVTEKWSEKYKKSINCNNPKGFSQKAHCQGKKKNLKENFENPEIFKSPIEKNLNEYASNYEWLDGIDADFTTTNTSTGWKDEYDTPLCMYTVKINSNLTPSYKEQSALFDDISFVHSLFFPLENGKPTCYFSTKTEYPSGDIKSFPSLRTMSENKEESTLIEGKYDLDKIKQALQMLSQVSESVGEFVPLEFKLYGYQLRTNDFGKRLDLYIDVDKDGDVYNTMSNYWHDLSNQLLDIFEMLGIRDERYMKPMYDFKFNKRPLYNIETV